MTALTDAEQLLARRAAALAAPLDDEGDVPTVELLTVTCDGRALGFETDRIRRILRSRSLCRLPHGDPHFVGMVSSHGEPVPVVDLATLLEGSAARTERPFVVLVDGDRPPVGLLVDEVVGVRRVPAELRVPATAQADGLERGLTEDGVVVLDTDRLLRDHRLELSTHERPPLSGGDTCAP